MRKWYNDHIDDRYIYALFNSDQNRRFPKPSEINNFQMIEDPDLLNHLHASWIRLIGET